MPTIRQALAAARGETEDTVAPIIHALVDGGFDVDAEDGVDSVAFRILDADKDLQKHNLNLRQRRALMAVIKGATAAGPGPASATAAIDAKAGLGVGRTTGAEGAGVGGAGGAGAGGLDNPSVTAEDDKVIVQRASESRKYTGHVLHPVLDPKTKELVLVPSCATVITPTSTATFSHHRTWKEGDEVELEMCNHVDTTRTRSIKAKVARIEKSCDFVILEHPDVELEAPIVDAGVGKPGMRFYGHGLSCPGGTSNVYHGILAGTTLNKRGHIFGDIASGKGDSGGGIFSVASGKLIGMMVGRDRDLQKSLIIPANVLVAAAAALTEGPADPDPPPSDQMMM